MTINFQTLRTPTGEELIVLSREEFDRLLEAAEDREDVEDATRILAAVRDGAEEVVPAEIVNRLIAGENKLRVWRSHRGMTLEELGAAIGASGAYLSMIETGKKRGSVDLFRKAAEALRVDLDDLL